MYSYSDFCKFNPDKKLDKNISGFPVCHSKKICIENNVSSKFDIK